LYLFVKDVSKFKMKIKVLIKNLEVRRIIIKLKLQGEIYNFIVKIEVKGVLQKRIVIENKETV